VITDILPLAVGIAASPFPIIPVILLLLTPRALAGSSSFLAGWAIGILTIAAVFVLLAEVLDPSGHPPTWASWARVALGIALVCVGARQWLSRGGSDKPPAWMQSIQSATPSGALRLGVLLSAANPKIVLLAAPAGLAIGAEAAAPAAATVAAMVFTAVAASTVAIPVLLYVILGDRILPRLQTAGTWLQANNRSVMAVVITVIGLVVLSKGIGGL